MTDWAVIVPDGVTHVRWMSSGPKSTLHKTISEKVQSNLAILPFTELPSYPHAVWYSADGRSVKTNPRLVTQAAAARHLRSYHQALAAAERERTTAPPAIINGFQVFRYQSAAGTRLADGYIVSKPPLTAIPEVVLSLVQFRIPGLGKLASPDLRQTRHVQSPSGQSMYIVPTSAGLCVYDTEARATNNPATATAAAGSCSRDIAQALTSGSGEAVGSKHRQVNYGVVPEKHPDQKITIRGGRTRRIDPSDGFYIIVS